MQFCVLRLGADGHVIDWTTHRADGDTAEQALLALAEQRPMLVVDGDRFMLLRATPEGYGDLLDASSQRSGAAVLRVKIETKPAYTVVPA